MKAGIRNLHALKSRYDYREVGSIQKLADGKTKNFVLASIFQAEIHTLLYLSFLLQLFQNYHELATKRQIIKRESKIKMQEKSINVF